MKILHWLVIFAALLVPLAWRQLDQDQRRRDNDFVISNINPMVGYVTNFKLTERRLPTQSEFQSWAAVNHPNKAVWYYDTKPPFVEKWGTAGADYLVGEWRGEVILFLQSWDKHTFTKEWVE